MEMLFLDAICTRIKDGLVNPSELTLMDKSGYDVSIVLTHNIQYACRLEFTNNRVTISIGGIDYHVTNATQVHMVADAILMDYRQQLAELDIIAQTKEPKPSRPTLSLDLTGLSADQVTRIITITKE